MTTPAPATAPWADRFTAVGPRLPGAGRVRALRDAAIGDLVANGFPTRRHEAWLYTSLDPVTGTAFGAAEADASALAERASALLATLPDLEGAARVVLVNGRLADDLSQRDALPEGVELVGLGAALSGGDADLEARLGTLVDGRGHALAALNTALFEDGLLLRVRRGARLAAPVHVVSLTLGGETPAASHPRLVYHVEDGAQAAVVEWWRGDEGADSLSNTAVEAWVGAGARLDLLEIQEQGLGTLHFRSLAVHQERDSHFACACLSIGARLARNDVRIRLADTGAECRLDGLSLAQGAQHVDHQTNIDHGAPHGTSHQLYKGVLDDHARAVFSGRVLVEPGAQKTDARQANHNLLLSPDAIADAKPQLEIFADDVKCAHGATVGQLDEDALFYLRSRGIGPRSARRLLLHAFASEIAERVPQAELAAAARAVIDRHLPGVEE